MTISQEILHPSNTKISQQITDRKFNSNLPGANELNPVVTNTMATQAVQVTAD